MAISEYPSLQLANRQTALNSAVEDVWHGIGSELMRPIFDTYNDDLHRAIDAIPSLNPDTAKQFKNNVTRIAAAKANYNIQLLSKAKQAANGNKAEYLRQAKVIMSRANRSQAAEYNTTVHRARSAQQWAVFQKQKHLYPNLQWLRTRSATPREVHLAYVGRIWAMDDPFWNSNQPGCTWNCKCSWKTTDAPVTNNKDVATVASAEGLEGNPFYTNEIFTNKHPYFSRVANHIPDVGILNNSDDVSYLNRNTKKGKSYMVHYLVKDAAETTQNEKIAQALADDGFKDVRLLPTINAKEPLIRKRYYGADYTNKTKCPDCSANGEMIEFKNTTFKNLSKNILEASKKTNTAVIKLSGNTDEAWLKRFCAKQFTLTDRQNLEKIIIVIADNVFIFKK